MQHGLDRVNSVYIAHTPYHVLLSLYLSLDQHAHENHLIVIGDTSRLLEFATTINKCWNPSPFKHTTYLSGMYEKSNWLTKQLLKKKNVKFMKKYFQNHSFQNIYVFNDRRPEIQAALYFSKKFGVNTAIYVEDGSIAYSSYRLRKFPLHIAFLAKLLFGFWWENISFFGGATWIDEVKLLFPDMARPELQLKPISGISKNNLEKLRNPSWIREILLTFNLEVENIKDIDAILVISHSEHVHGRHYMKWMEVLDLIDNNNLRAAVKYHPGESKKDFLSIRGRERYFLLPQSLPVELLYILLGRQMKYVVGSDSSSLLTARWFLEDVIVCSIAPALGYVEDRLMRVFNRTGIRLIHNLNQLNEILR